MNWLDKFKDKGGQPDVPAAQGGGQVPDRAAGGTVVRPGVIPAPTIAKPVRFQPNHDVTVDLQIKSLLGSGGMGEVYLARQRQWDVDVALKIPNDEIVSDPENRHRIVREAEAWTDLGLHPNIAYCHYAQPLGELLLLVIEYADGGNLRGWIADGRCADLKTGLDLAIQLCHGLERAHKKGLVHRDIKPENVLLMKDGTLKITDFGIVRKTLASQETLESTGAVRRAAAGMTTAGIGTADYMAPEQWGDQTEIDSRADIFAFGVCLYEMLCGARPYPITAGPRKDAPEPGRLRGKSLPDRLSRLMRRCADWDRDRRPSDAQEVRAELCTLYEEHFGEPCLHAELPELTSQADDWNNRALSYLALGRFSDAGEAFKVALASDRQHPESTFNLSLIMWRQGVRSDADILSFFRGVSESDPSSWLPKYLTAQIHLERGDADGAKQELANIRGVDGQIPEVATARRAAEEFLSPSRFVRTFESTAVSGYSCSVRSVSMNADGTLALSGGWDKSPKLWDVTTGRCIRKFEEEHVDSVTAVSLSGNGRVAVSGSVDKTVKLWDVKSGSCVRTWVGHNDAIMSVCLSNRMALSSSRDKTIRLWGLLSGRCVRSLEGHTEPINSISASADGRFVLSGSADRTLRLWETKSGHCLRIFEGHQRAVNCVYLYGEEYALSGSDDQTAKLWDLKTGECLRTFGVHPSDVRSVCPTQDGLFFLSGSEKTVMVWDLKSGRCIRTFEGHTEDVRSVCSIGRYAISGGDLRLWEIGTFPYRANYRLARATGSRQAVVATSRYRAALSSARTAVEQGDALQASRYLKEARQEPGHRRAVAAVQAWGDLYVRLRRGALADCWLHWVSPGELPASFKALGSGGVTLLASRPLDRSGVIVSLLQIDARTGAERIIGEPRVAFESAAISQDAKHIVLARFLDGKMDLLDALDGSLLRTLSGHEKGVNSVCFTADGLFVLSGSVDKTVRIWDTASGFCLRILEGHTDEVRSVCCSADGRIALSASWDNTLKVWEVASGRCVRTLSGHAPYIGSVNSVSLSVDGRFALSGSNDKTVKFWDTQRGLCLRTLEGHTDPVNSVCLSDDGRFAVSGSRDKTLIVWDVTSGTILRTLSTLDSADFARISADGRYAIGERQLWFLDWELEENAPADWDEQARPYLEGFLSAHQPYAAAIAKDRPPTAEELMRALTRVGKPTWKHEEWLGLLKILQCAGYGWLRPDGVGRELERMAAGWENRTEPPHVPPGDAGPKVGRNDPCPCGSGERYKKCHGA